uniref:Thioredoxin domain-containing protein n=1 Tax=Quercus lobata TaxID=97700 RepID=A0A7N2R7K2_QUELO
MTNSDETLASRMGDNNVEPPKPGAERDVDGDFLDRALASKWRNEYIVVLFHASWCPFSRSVLPSFETLNSMFPQIEHMTIEQSSAMPRCDAY